MAPSELTAQGRATRERIVAAAATMIAERGASGTSLDAIRAATKASKSQLYHYFGDKRGLVRAVIDYQSAAVLEAQAEALGAVGDWKGLERWADAMVAAVEARGGRGGCPIGTLAAAVSDTDERFRAALSDAFETWSDAIGAALGRLRDHGLLAPDADLEALTTVTLAAIQGGLLLAKTRRESAPLRAALDGAIAHLRARGAPPRTRARRR
ncbi:MAG TPA: TetR family transcriptional regulator C-terminal domain-containing protein [Solirubrobacteraceae bacterium]|jgi:AcrR family transcriptional regulator|nr:TetR family transcriptional regulator C-terminal domain-containing protein [Solirubrobacteraceae bacterium]